MTVLCGFSVSSLLLRGLFSNDKKSARNKPQHKSKKQATFHPVQSHIQAFRACESDVVVASLLPVF